MTKTKTPPPEDQVAAASTPATEGQDTVAAEGQDTVQASTEGQDTVAGDPGATDQPGADDPPADDAAADAPEAPQLNVAALTYCARQIDMLNTFGHRLGLIDELTQLYGMEVRDKEGGVTVECEGVTSPLSDTVENALTNWANAARRACLEAAG